MVKQDDHFIATFGVDSIALMPISESPYSALVVSTSKGLVMSVGSLLDFIEQWTKPKQGK